MGVKYSCQRLVYDNAKGNKQFIILKASGSGTV